MRRGKSWKLALIILALLFAISLSAACNNTGQQVADNSRQPEQLPPREAVEDEPAAGGDEEPPEVPDPDPYPGGSGPVAYLTFDDGPSKNTLLILDILSENGIPATFFVTGNNVSGDREVYKKIASGGHTLGNHTFSHKFDSIYLSVDKFIEDFMRLEEFLITQTGVRPQIFRFPGGSKSSMSKKVSGYDIVADIINELTAQGYDYFDWNVSSGDGTATPPKDDIVENVMSKADQVNGDLVILFHDSPAKLSTVEALPDVIRMLKERGYEFAALNPGIINVKHR